MLMNHTLFCFNQVSMPRPTAIWQLAAEPWIILFLYEIIQFEVNAWVRANVNSEEWRTKIRNE